LSDDQQNRIQRSYGELVRILDSKGDLIAKLYSSDCITELQKQYIESATTPRESNKRLINIVRRGSGVNFDKFIECLNKTGQRHVSRILVEDGVVTYMVATVTPKQKERLIVEKLTDLLRSTPEESREDVLGKLCNEARQRVRQLSDNEVAILKTEVGHSI